MSISKGAMLIRIMAMSISIMVMLINKGAMLISNVQGEAIAYANIYIPQLKNGTTSSIDGRYELKLPEGNYKVLFQYLGYQTQSQEVIVTKSFQEINIQLITQDYKIPEIIIIASGEDPAYYIMRHAIA